MPRVHSPPCPRTLSPSSPRQQIWAPALRRELSASLQEFGRFQHLAAVVPAFGNHGCNTPPRGHHRQLRTSSIWPQWFQQLATAVAAPRLHGHYMQLQASSIWSPWFQNLHVTVPASGNPVAALRVGVVIVDCWNRGSCSTQSPSTQRSPWTLQFQHAAHPL